MSIEDENEIEGEGAVVTKPKDKVKEPKMYKVILHNDDFTPMDFVIEILETVFRKSSEVAARLMLEVHHKGMAICGIYPADIAETKVTLVQNAAKEHKYPLKVSMESE